MVPVPGSHFLSLVRIHHKDKEGGLHSLQNYDLTKGILLAISRGERSISTEFFSPGDLERLKQIGLDTESDVDLVLEFPWDVRSFLAIVAKANNTQLRRRVLAMAVDRLRKTASLTRILEFKSSEVYTIRENPYLGAGHPPYENFIQSLLKITDTSIPAGEELLELFLNSAADEVDETTLTCVEKRGIRTVFHGTTHAVMDAILKSGLDPNRRRPGLLTDYFGIDSSTSGRHSHTGPYTQLLVFLIILDPPIGSEHLTSGEVTVESNTRQLPLAEITTYCCEEEEEEEDNWGEPEPSSSEELEDPEEWNKFCTFLIDLVCNRHKPGPRSPSI